MNRSNSFRASSSVGKRNEGSAVSILPVLPISTPNLDTIEPSLGTSALHRDAIQQRSQSAQDYRREACHSEAMSFASPTSSQHDKLTGWNSNDVALPTELSTQIETSASLEFLDHETEDISHVSYLFDKDPPLGNDVLEGSDGLSEKDRLLARTGTVLGSEITDAKCKDGEGSSILTVNDKYGRRQSPPDEVSYTLREPLKEAELKKDNSGNDRGRRMERTKRANSQKSRHELRVVYDNRADHKIHPVLFAKAKRLGRSSKKLTPLEHQIHFVSVHSLPSLESYSYQDDTCSDPFEELINRKLEKLKAERGAHKKKLCSEIDVVPLHHRSESDMLARDSPSSSVKGLDKEAINSARFASENDLIDFDGVDSETDFESMELIADEASLRDREQKRLEVSARFKWAINEQIIVENMKVHLPDDFDKERSSAAEALLRFESERSLLRADLLAEQLLSGDTGSGSGASANEPYYLKTAVISYYLSTSHIF